MVYSDDTSIFHGCISKLTKSKGKHEIGAVAGAYRKPSRKISRCSGYCSVVPRERSLSRVWVTRVSCALRRLRGYGATRRGLGEGWREVWRDTKVGEEERRETSYYQCEINFNFAWVHHLRCETATCTLLLDSLAPCFHRDYLAGSRTLVLGGHESYASITCSILSTRVRRT